MNEYFTTSFYVEEGNLVGRPERIDRWLTSLNKHGYGTSVLGYVSAGDAIYITVKRWKLADSVYQKTGYPGIPTPVPGPIQEHPPEAEISYDEPMEKEPP